MLELANVSYSYVSRTQRTDVLKNVNYRFEAQKLYAIQGQSGSGKSTLLSLLAALYKPNQGQLLLDDKPVEGYKPDVYRQSHVAMIFQNFCLLPFFTVLENVMLTAEIQKLDKDKAQARAKELLTSVEIGEKLFGRYPAHLSGGEQQRVAIARALCSNASVLLADEPTGNLDKQNAENIFNLLCSLAHQQQKTVIMVTHDSGLASRADVHLLLENGALEMAE